jgi:hypothetical protein
MKDMQSFGYFVVSLGLTRALGELRQKDPWRTLAKEPPENSGKSTLGELRQKNSQRTPAKEPPENSDKRTLRELRQKNPRRTPAKEPPENSSKRTLGELRQTFALVLQCSPEILCWGIFLGGQNQLIWFHWFAPNPCNHLNWCVSTPMSLNALVLAYTNEND